MAVDTKQKRFSMMEFGEIGLGVLFQADGAVDADDKYFQLALYSGITLDSPSAVDPAIKLVVRNVVQDVVRDAVRNPDDWKTT